MSLLRNLASGIRSLFRKEQVDRDLDEELRAYQEMAAEAKVRDGMSRQEALRAVRLERGTLEVSKEIVRSGGWESFVHTCWQDVSFAARILRKSPGFTAVAVLTLAFGIGANTAIFSLFDAIILQQLPVPQPDRLVLFGDSTGEGTSGIPASGQWKYYSYESFQYLSQQQLPLESLCAIRAGEDPVTIRIEGESQGGQVRRAITHLVSGSFFDAMGVTMTLGRAFSFKDDLPSAPPVTVVSYGYWMRELRADPGAIGKTVLLNNNAFIIVGVAPPEFFGERVRDVPDFWLPLVFQPQIEQHPLLNRTDVRWLNLMGRLRADVTHEQAQTAATVGLQRYLAARAGSQLTEERKRDIANSYILLFNGGVGLSEYRHLYLRALQVLLVVVGLVLLIACANVGNLLIARAAYRRSELNVRLALGASPWRLVRQLLTESVLLALLGGSCGILLAWWAVQLAGKLVDLGALVHPRLNLPVLAFTAGTTLLAAVLFGLIPAVRSGRTDVAAALKAGGGRRTTRRGFSTTNGLVVAQIALSLVLIVGASLFARSLANLEHFPLGFDRENVLLGKVNARLAGYKPAEASVLYRKLYDQVNALPGVRVATIARFSPLSGSRWTDDITVQGYAARPGESMSMVEDYVMSQYPETMGMKLLMGRAIGPQDTGNTETVAMVNETFVRHYFPNESPIGRRFGEDVEHSGKVEIIGVLTDASFENPKEKREDMAFFPLLQAGPDTPLQVELELRTSRDPLSLAALVRQTVAQVDPKLELGEIKSLQAQVDSNFDQERLAARLVSFFGLLALLLACLGLYGVLAYSVSQRINEIGIRMALGAERRQVMGLILGHGTKLTIAGVAIGLLAALAAGRLVSRMLFGIKPSDPATMVVAATLLVVLNVVACYLPARRAMSVDPMVALRYE
jgi:predicted permease